MTLDYIFSNRYLFEMVPSTASRLYLPLLIIFGLMLALAFVVRFVRFIDQPLRIFFLPLLSVSLAGLIYLFARHESLPTFSARFVILLICLVGLVWLIWDAVITVRVYPKYLLEMKREERFVKYLPKSKRK